VQAYQDVKGDEEKLFHCKYFKGLRILITRIAFLGYGLFRKNLFQGRNINYLIYFMPE
jgi:hypothetical protein